MLYTILFNDKKGVNEMKKKYSTPDLTIEIFETNKEVMDDNPVVSWDDPWENYPNGGKGVVIDPSEIFGEGFGK